MKAKRRVRKSREKKAKTTKTTVTTMSREEELEFRKSEQKKVSEKNTNRK